MLDHKGKKTSNSSSNLEGESLNQNFIMEIIKKTYPCTLCGSNAHYVAK